MVVTRKKRYSPCSPKKKIAQGDATILSKKKPPSLRPPKEENNADDNTLDVNSVDLCTENTDIRRSQRKRTGTQPNNECLEHKAPPQSLKRNRKTKRPPLPKTGNLLTAEDDDVETVGPRRSRRQKKIALPSPLLPKRKFESEPVSKNKKKRKTENSSLERSPLTNTVDIMTSESGTELILSPQAWTTTNKKDHPLKTGIDILTTEAGTELVLSPKSLTTSHEKHVPETHRTSTTAPKKRVRWADQSEQLSSPIETVNAVGVLGNLEEREPPLTPVEVLQVSPSQELDTTPAALEEAIGLSLEEVMASAPLDETTQLECEPIALEDEDDENQLDESTSQRIFSFPFKNAGTLDIALNAFPKLELINGAPLTDSRCLTRGSVHQRSLEKLTPGEFLSDEIVSFWFYILSAIGGEGTVSVYVFTSYAYGSLRDYGAGKGCKVVKKWLEKKGVNVLEKSFWLLPINYADHWSLVVVCNAGSLVGESQDADAPCTVFHLDSLRAAKLHSSRDILKNVKSLVKTLYLSLDPNAGTWKPTDVRTCIPDVPQQGRGTNDCALMVCSFGAEIFCAAKSQRYLTIFHLRGTVTTFFDVPDAFSVFSEFDTSQLRSTFRLMLTTIGSQENGNGVVDDGQLAGDCSENAVIVIDDDEAFVELALDLMPRTKMTFAKVREPKREKNGQTSRKNRQKKSGVSKTADGTAFVRFGKLSTQAVRDKVLIKYEGEKAPKRKRIYMTEPLNMIQTRDSTARGQLGGIATRVQQSWVTTIQHKTHEKRDESLYACLTAVAPLYANGSPSGKHLRGRPMLLHLCPEHALPLANQIMAAQQTDYDVRIVHDAREFGSQLMSSTFREKRRPRNAHDSKADGVVAPSSTLKGPRQTMARRPSPIRILFTS